MSSGSFNCVKINSNDVTRAVPSIRPRAAPPGPFAAVPGSNSPNAVVNSLAHADFLRFHLNICLTFYILISIAY